MSSKLILVLGATGAQGIAVIDSLLAPAADGSPSPYKVRALTRDANSRRAKVLQEKGVELAIGDTDNLPSVKAALQGVYGAWINIDTFTVGEFKEVFQGLRIFEFAKQAGVKHYVWSSLEYISKLTGYNDEYRSEHYDSKGRVAEFIQMQPSAADDAGLAWSVVNTGPYMDMLSMSNLGPTRREDGTFVFTAPIGNGHVPMIALKDLGWWARYTFDHRQLVSGRVISIASDMVDWPYLVKTFTKVTGKKAVFQPVSIEQAMAQAPNPDRPAASNGIDSMTWRQSFSGWWAAYRDDKLKKDMDWLRKVHPGTLSLEKWMREVGYDGVIGGEGERLLKDVEDHTR
ncbi:NAD-P-binding protein [Dentipellis sp. KUC8613]|nr:NAD-P-binding protein [Dentipellis sp. KUC8613]